MNNNFKKQKIVNFTTKLFILLFLVVTIPNPSVYAANTVKTDVMLQKEIDEKIISIDIKNLTIVEALKEVQRLSGIGYGFHSQADTNLLNQRVSVSLTNVSVKKVLDTILEGKKLIWQVQNGKIFISTAPSPTTVAQKPVELKGKVVDSDGKPVVGATLISVSGVGTITDNEGQFALTLPQSEEVEVSSLGYVTVIQTIDESNSSLTIKMEIDEMAVDDVVVTGFFERNKNTFTGAAKTIKGDELRQISNTNIMNALSIIDPSLQIVTNNEQGSNPNNIPELIIRGTSSLNAANEAGANSPLIVIDGVESSLTALYDMDIADIESVTTLKDASATALYGEQAANGVILITRVRSNDKALRVSYNFTGQVQFADVSDYNMMNAEQKLAFELASGCYEDSTGDLMLDYAEKLKRVKSGVDTDWLSLPLRNSFSNTHSLNVSGQGSDIYYQVTARLASTNGVMKDDNRKNTGVGVYFSHNLNEKLITTLRADYTENATKATKYGAFSSYVNANPYDAPYDENGELQKILSYDLANPLYEATLESFGKTKTKTLTASLNVRWNVMDGFYVTAFGSVESSDYRSDNYKSPYSSFFQYVTDLTEKGYYSVNTTSGSAYYGKITANYIKAFDDKGTMLTVNAGGELRKEDSYPQGYTVYGFFDDNLTDPTFAHGFLDGATATGESSESSSVAFVSAANFTFRNRYFVDASYRVSGSSKFGSDQRYAPYWSVGAGWNIHKEAFAENIKWLDVARLRGSYGHTGSIAFSSYQAITTYRYDSDYKGIYGMGAAPITMGNTNLKWQTTKKINVGLTSTLLDNRLDINFDIYKDRTVDMIVPISMPLSTGQSEAYTNFGEQENKGFDFTVAGTIIKNSKLIWKLTFNGLHNKNKLIELGDALVTTNNYNAAISGSSPLQLYVEGESTTAIYVVRSAGIDPATGQEIYIDKDGVRTMVYDASDKVAVGDTTPVLQGAISSYLNYKGIYLNISAQYSNGGYLYNSTRAMRVEQINPMYNSDLRAYTQRWLEPGDVVEYVAATPNAYGYNTYYHSERFVEKENYLNISNISLGYEFSNEFLSKIGFKRLNVSANMSDVARFSTVKQERGTSYPFARSFSFTISPTF